MRYFGKEFQLASYVASAIILVLGLASVLIITHYRFSPTYIVPTDTDSSNYFLADELIAAVIIGAFAPVTVISFSNYRYLKAVERNIPQFLRDVLQGTDSGLMLPKALIAASKNGHGPVSTEFGIAMTKFSFGYDFSRSVQEAGERLRHPFAPQVAVIISEAYAAGARMHDVLSSSVLFFNNLEQYSEQRQSELKPYTQLVYISIAVFLVICLVVLSSFIVPLTSMHAAPSQPSSIGLSGFFKTSSFMINSTGLSYYTSIFFFAAVMESLFAGMVAGKIVDSSAGAGMRHSVILVSICAAVFLFASHFIA